MSKGISESAIEFAVCSEDELPVQRMHQAESLLPAVQSSKAVQ